MKTQNYSKKELDEAVRMKYSEGLSISEIARRQHRDKSCVSRHLKKLDSSSAKLQEARRQAHNEKELISGNVLVGVVFASVLGWLFMGVMMPRTHEHFWMFILLAITFVLILTALTELVSRTIFNNLKTGKEESDATSKGAH